MDVLIKEHQVALLAHVPANLKDICKHNNFEPDFVIFGLGWFNHKYFNKIECFCFEEQLLQPGEKLTMPVRFIIDPDLPSDVPVLTLGYTLFDITESHIKLQASN